MLSNYNQNTNTSTFHLTDNTEQYESRQCLVKNLIECSLLVNRLITEEKFINFASDLEQKNLISLLRKLAFYKTSLADNYFKARLNMNAAFWLMLEKTIDIISCNEKTHSANITILKEFIKKTEILINLNCKINEEIACIASPINPIENTKSCYDNQYNIFLKQGGVYSFIKAISSKHYIQYEILKNGELVNNQISYLEFYLAALLNYIGEENLKKFYFMCRYSDIISKDEKLLVITDIFPAKTEEKFIFLENEIVYLFKQGDLFLLSMVLKNISLESKEFFLNQLLGYSSYFSYINEDIKKTVIPLVTTLDQCMLSHAILLVIKNYDVTMFNYLAPLLKDFQYLADVFFEIIKLSPDTDKEMAFQEMIFYFLTNYHCFIELQDKEKNLYPFLFLLLSANPIKLKLANEFLSASSLSLKRQYVIFLYENSANFEDFSFAKMLFSALSFDDILFVIKTCHVHAPSFLHTLIEKSNPDDYLAYAITQSRVENEDSGDFIFSDLPAHWCQESLKDTTVLKEHGHELIFALHKSNNISLKEVTLKIVKHYLKDKLGSVSYKQMLAQHESALKIAIKQIKNKEVEIQVDNTSVSLVFYPIAQEENQAIGNKRRIDTSINMSTRLDKDIERVVYKKQRSSCTLDMASKSKWQELKPVLNSLKKEPIQCRQSCTNQKWLRHEFRKAIIAEQQFILDKLLPFITINHLLTYFFQIIADNKKKREREFAINYLIGKFPSFLSVREQNVTKRYPIIIFLGNATASEKENIGRYLIEQSSLELRKAYFNFILDGKSPYKKFRRMLTESLPFEVLLSMSKERGFPIPFSREGYSCIHLLHKTIVEQSNDVELITYAIEQSRYCKISPMLNNLHPEWDVNKLKNVVYLKMHGHELFIAAASGYHKKSYGKDGMSVLEVSIQRYFNHLLGEETAAEILSRQAIRSIEEQSQTLSTTVTMNSPYLENNPYLVFNHASPPLSSPLTPLFMSNGSRNG